MIETISALEKVRRDMERNIFNLTKDGKCTGCGSCCSNYLVMSRKEIRDIRRYIRKHKIEACKRNLPLAGAAIDMTCPFLDLGRGNKKCTIYEVRPFVCRKFICDSEQREPIKPEDVAVTRKVVSMREVFFNESY